MTTAEFSFRQGAEADASRILELFNLAFGKSRTLQQWRWRFINCPVKKLIVTVALDKAGRIIAHHALHPVWLVHKGEQVLGAQSVDAMVHSEFRGKGLFTETARRCEELAFAQGVQILYAFQDIDSHSYRGFVNLGWQNLPEFCRLFYLLNPRRVLQLRAPNPVKRLLLTAPFSVYLWWKQRRRGFQAISNRSVQVTEINKFDSSFDALWQECKNQFAAGVWKDSEYLQWRYKEVPGSNYTVLKATEDGKTAGFIVTCSTIDRGLKAGLIADIVCREPVAPIASALIQAAVSLFRREGVDLVQTVLLRGSPYLTAFRASGFFKRFLRERIRVIVKCIGAASGVQSVAKEKWHLVDGDRDIE